MSEITKSTIVNSLKKIQNKSFNTNLLTLNTIKKVEVDNNILSLELSLITNNSHEVKELIIDQLKKDFMDLTEYKSQYSD